MEYIKNRVIELKDFIKQKLENKETRFAQILEWISHPVVVILVASGLFFLLESTSELIIVNFNALFLLGFIFLVSVISFFILRKYLPDKQEVQDEQTIIKKLYNKVMYEGERIDLAVGITGIIDLFIFFIAVMIFKYPIPDIYIFAAATLSVVMATLGAMRFIWKISVHCGISSLIITSFTLWRFWQFVWLYVFLIPIIYSRLKLERHTVGQTIGGILFGVLIPTVLFFFVYLNPELVSLIQSLYN